MEMNSPAPSSATATACSNLDDIPQAGPLGILHRKLFDLEQVLPELDEADSPRLWRLWHEMIRVIADTDPHVTD
ncbi:hypothetical protein ABZY57_04940 [Streptomyces sp. NPDC006450]|uniref:hypothetical protein n=1 Tax=Streptomyces sp. NPDC006450 TaxID=3155458 RepID=UPI0033A7963E